MFRLLANPRFEQLIPIVRRMGQVDFSAGTDTLVSQRIQSYASEK
jgi:hypothetical protein